MKNVFSLIGILLTIFFACNTPGDRDFNLYDLQEDEEEIPWDDLISLGGGIFSPGPNVFLEEVLINEEIAKLDPLIKNDPKLLYLALSRSMKDPEPYDLGIVGRVGTATFYASTLNKIPDWDRLYWVMVRVLSEKYSCLMRAKIKKNNVFLFTCKDGRRVVFWRSKGENWIQFHARQYDLAGNELILNSFLGDRHLKKNQ